MAHKKKREKNKPFEPIPRERALVVWQAPELMLPPALLIQKRKRSWKRWVLPVAAALFLGTTTFAYYWLDVPNWQTLDTQKLTGLSQTSRLYDQDGTLVAALKGRENRTVISLDKVPLVVQNAFIAAEDLRFYTHNGFDLVRLGGSLVANLRSQSLSEGASTISQQLIKLTHLSQAKTFQRKAEELYLSIQLEGQFTKEEILSMYLNTIYFGEGAYGIEAAARRYFDKSAADLTLAEGAALAATLKAPGAYGLIASEEANRIRRAYILRTMAENDMISAEEAAAATAATLTVYEPPPTTKAQGWFIDAALWEAESLLGVSADAILSGGYYIETTLDPRLQQSAEDLFASSANFPQNATDGTPVQSALAVCDTKTGALRALIGGREYKVQRGFNRAIQMRRQPGSALKPLAVYAPALQKGYTTASVLSDDRQDFGGGYTPRNSGNVYHGNVTVRRALALSMNVATVGLMRDIGITASTNFLKKAGIPITDTDYNLSLALGAMTTGVTPAELTAAYAMFGNQGVYNAPYTIEKIFDANGQLLYSHDAAPRTVLSAQEAYLMTSLLQSVTAWGTGAKLSNTGLAVAGKTGTVSLVGTPGNRDIWMAAYTSDLAVACWMGFDVTDAKHALPSRQSGGDATAAMVTAFYKAAYRNQTKPAFANPGGFQWVTLDTAATLAMGKPLLATGSTPDQYKLSELFLASNKPTEYASVWNAPRAVSYFYIDYNNTGLPKLVFAATDNANYRIERTRNGATTVLTEIYGDAGQTLSYVDWNAAPGEWYTYRVTPIHSAMLGQGILLEGPSAQQSVQAKAVSGGWW